MFETTREVLAQLGNFAIIGFFLGFLYDIFRFIRIVIPHSRFIVNIEDMLFLTFSGFVLFYFSLEIGQGAFRLYYAVSALFGAAVFRFTFGFLTAFIASVVKKLLFVILNFMNRLFLVPIKNFFGKMYQKAKRVFGTMYRKSEKIAEKARLHLKKKPEIVYNDIISSMDIMGKVGGEERSVIKAKVRKKA